MIVEVNMNSAICHTLLPLSITLSFEDGGRGKVPYKSSFVCPRCVGTFEMTANLVFEKESFSVQICDGVFRSV